jgi:predicted membrane-bound mannosyltransferase
MSSSSSPSRLKLWLVALVVFAAAVRLVGLDFDDKHFFHPDERRIAFAIEELSFQPLQLSPHFLAYGSFPFYVVRGVASLLSHVSPGFIHYDGIMMTGRAVSGVIGTLTVLLGSCRFDSSVAANPRVIRRIGQYELAM